METGFILLVLLFMQLQIFTWNYSIKKRLENICYLINIFKPRMVMKGNELIFLRRINKYGESSIEEAKEELHQDDDFQITCLSISEGTYIAHGFSTFVVKLKNK